MCSGYVLPCARACALAGLVRERFHETCVGRPAALDPVGWGTPPPHSPRVAVRSGRRVPPPGLSHVAGRARRDGPGGASSAAVASGKEPGRSARRPEGASGCPAGRSGGRPSGDRPRSGRPGRYRTNQAPPHRFWLKIDVGGFAFGSGAQGGVRTCRPFAGHRGPASRTGPAELPSSSSRHRAVSSRSSGRGTALHTPPPLPPSPPPRTSRPELVPRPRTCPPDPNSLSNPPPPARPARPRSITSSEHPRTRALLGASRRPLSWQHGPHNSLATAWQSAVRGGGPVHPADHRGDPEAGRS